MARTEVIFMAFRNFCNRPWCGAQDLRRQDRRLLCIMARRADPLTDAPSDTLANDSMHRLQPGLPMVKWLFGRASIGCLERRSVGQSNLRVCP